jgi:hypothetical protein
MHVQGCYTRRPVTETIYLSVQYPFESRTKSSAHGLRGPTVGLPNIDTGVLGPLNGSRQNDNSCIEVGTCFFVVQIEL